MPPSVSGPIAMGRHQLGIPGQSLWIDNRRPTSLADAEKELFKMRAMALADELALRCRVAEKRGVLDLTFAGSMDFDVERYPLCPALFRQTLCFLAGLPSIEYRTISCEFAFITTCLQCRYRIVTHKHFHGRSLLVEGEIPCNKNNREFAQKQIP